MDKLNEKYPVSDPENENIQETMEALKLKYRIIRAALGVKLSMMGSLNRKRLHFESKASFLCNNLGDNA